MLGHEVMWCMELCQPASKCGEKSVCSSSSAGLVALGRQLPTYHTELSQPLELGLRQGLVQTRHFYFISQS